MKRFLKITGLVMALPLLLALLAILYGGYLAMVRKPADDPARIASKQAYLEAISKALPVEGAPRPNILVILYDDLGFGDFGFTGGMAIRTPNIDSLARDGVVLTQFHTASPVCSPSRAGFLTGRLPPRAGVPNVVYQSDSLKRLISYSNHGGNRLPAEEIIFPEILKAAGYHSYMVGKWHLGDHSPSLPNEFGFDSFLGSLHSNDMEPFAIWNDTRVKIPAPADQSKLDEVYTREVIRLLRQSRASEKPFLLYFAHNFPHEPLHTDHGHHGRSTAGLYGDVVEMLDDSVGRIVAELKKIGQFDNTIIIVTSDNGPWFQGSPGPHRGRKGETLEGGTHVPFLIHWPAGLKGGRSVEHVAMGTDLLPTLLEWLRLPLPADRAIDGRSLVGALEERAGPAGTPVYFYSGNRLTAVSNGRYKYLPRQPHSFVISGSALSFGKDRGPWLFDIMNDPGEAYDISDRQPQITAQLQKLYEAKEAEMARNPRGWK